jgi:uncharacterized membrane protein
LHPVGPGRLHALIDGVFAIAVTLLVLDLPRPGGSEHLAHDLLQQWPEYLISDQASFITGVSLDVDGGQSLGFLQVATS